VIYDPFKVPLFDAAALRVAIIILVLLALAAYRRSRSQASSHQSAMLIKMLTVAWLAPVLMVAVFSGGIVLLIIVTLVLIAALTEYARLAALERPYAIILTVFSLGAIGLAATITRDGYYLLLVFLLFLVLTTIPIASGKVVGAQRQIGAVLLGFFYISPGLSVIIYTRRVYVWGLAFLVLVGTAVALCDAGGYLVGKAFGGPKMAPNVSPNKTWSGAVGGFLGAAIGIAFQWPFLGHWHMYYIAILAPITTIGAVWGDLIESIIKRDRGVKDAGELLKGFGGVLDRFDSFLVAVPLSYLVVLASR
jgi:phosphatidate cytidylyltransferase